MTLEKKIISTSKAPEAIGPYSQGVVSNGHIFLSGQIPLDQNGELNDGTIQEQVELIFENICLLYTSPSPRDKRQSRMPSSA